jgi:hypothetical protein
MPQSPCFDTLQEARQYYVQLVVVGPTGVPLPPPGPAGLGQRGVAVDDEGSASAATAVRPDTVARTETASLARAPEFANRAFVLHLPQPLGASLHSRALLQVSLFALPSLDAPPGPLLAGGSALLCKQQRQQQQP